MRILIADDDLVGRLVLQGLLKRFGHVVAVVSGEDALDSISAALNNGKPFDLVCLDVEMGGISGVDTLLRLRAIESERGQAPLHITKVLMVTGTETMDIGMQDFMQDVAWMTKPASLDAVQRQLVSLGLPHQQRGCAATSNIH
jgi:two-component system chemotaxis response regulator CheY